MAAPVQGEPTLARQALLDRLTKIDPNMGTIVTAGRRAGRFATSSRRGYPLACTSDTR